MYLASDNTSGTAPEVMAALLAANDGYQPGYGNEALMGRVTGLVRETFEAPEAEVHLVATGTAANALSLATLCPPWSSVFCHETAHIEMDEGAAPEFFSGGSKLKLIAGADGKICPQALAQALARAGGSIHNVEPGALSLTNLTEPGTAYSPAEIQALTTQARARGMRVHMDGARFANAVIATGASAADLTWRAGVDILSFGGTKNGCMGVEAVVLFDPKLSREFQLRRKRAGHLFSKHRFLAAQMEAYLTDGLWLKLAAQANRAGARLAAGLAAIPGVTLRHPVSANMMFVDWPLGTHAKLKAQGAAYYDDNGVTGEGARLVTSWSTTDAEIDAFLAAFAR